MQIVIAGGGPGGAVCARTLAKAGHRAILIEASRSSDKPCAGGLPSMLFEHYAIPDLLVKQRTSGVIFQAPSGLRIHAEFPEGQYIATVNRHEFDSHLRWAAEDAGAIQVDGRVLGYDEKGNKLLVRYRGPDGNVRTTEADYLIGADGAHSRVARQTMGELLPMVIGIQEVIEPVPDRMQVLGNNCLFNYSPAVSPDFYGWIFPKGEQVSVGIGTRLENRTKLQTLLNRMKEMHSDLLEGGKSIKRNGALIPSGQYKEHGLRRVLLVGDAAGFVLSASGEGIYFAMRSGEIAAEAIVAFGEKRSDILVSKYTDMVNREISPIFNYFSKIERITYKSTVNREVFVRLTKDKFMARKILSAFSTKIRYRTPFFKKIAVMFELLAIRLNVALTVSRHPDFGK